MRQAALEYWVIASVLALGAATSCRPNHAKGGGADASPDDGGAEASVALADAAPPADDAIPEAPAEELAGRAQHLLEAIARDDAQLATDVVFPRDGWLATREVADAGKEWEKRVASPFRRAIHALSRRHTDFDRARVVSVDLGHTMVQQTLRRHSWKKALWTVRESRLTFVIDGRTQTLPIREMTAWRGAWYVTRLR